nr:unnamed protein product [Callosobruchus analis]CAI5844542.1 unnamed protein product [Callosobruchus analis]CAI5844543.1 unnamed protein product [Callosobruchus analis]CAI5844544.1 unnamed protein product [Callosobruchus analis]
MSEFNITNYPSDTISDRFTRTFTDFLQFTSLTQLNSIQNSTGRLLHLVISDLQCEVHREDILILREDMCHPSLCYASSQHETSLKTNLQQTCYNFRKSNYIDLYNALTYSNWSFLSEANDPNIMCDLFYNRPYLILNMYVPKYTKYRRSYPKWYTAEIIRNIKLKYNLQSLPTN